MRRVFAFLFALALLGVTSSALADVPTEMSVQGRLTNGAGAPVPAGFKNFTFKIYDSPVAGVEIWPGGPGETQLLSTDANGLWNAGVGTLIPLTEAVFLSPVRWLEVTVNDGVNPIETLPRIELRTNPYTYRSATSQQADSIGGLSLFDLADRFVDTSGDVMTGPLRNLWSQENLGTSIDIQNNSDGYGPAWANGVGTWGLQSEAQSNDNVWNIGVATIARGDNSAVEGNRGVYSIAGGSNSVNVGVEAWTFNNGTANYSGYFHDGDFLISSPSTPGTGGVLLPPDAIDNTEILDEAGLASGVRLGFNGLVTTTPTTFATVTITTPGPGYVLVLADANFRGSGATTYISANVYENGGFAGDWYWDSGDADGWFDLTQSLHAVRTVGAGVYTYDLRLSLSAGTCDVYDAKITAVYLPTAYGSISSPVAERGGINSADEAARVPTRVSLDVEADKTQSIAANQARVDREMADMRAEIEALKKLLPAGSVNAVAAQEDRR